MIKGMMNSVRRAFNVRPLEPRENEKKEKRKEEGTVVKSELKWRVTVLKGLECVFGTYSLDLGILRAEIWRS